MCGIYLQILSLYISVTSSEEAAVRSRNFRTSERNGSIPIIWASMLPRHRDLTMSTGPASSKVLPAYVKERQFSLGRSGAEEARRVLGVGRKVWKLWMKVEVPVVLIEEAISSWEFRSLVILNKENMKVQLDPRRACPWKGCKGR